MRLTRGMEFRVVMGVMELGVVWMMLILTTTTVMVLPDVLEEPKGSNGFAIAPINSVTGNSLLLINPHTSFFFRAELHMVSDEGLNTYGATTWGQFFVYQGFNENAGWMHTSTRADAIDEYLETVVHQDNAVYYTHGEKLRPFATRQVSVPYKTGTGLSRRTFTTYRNHHGPVVRSQEDHWVTTALMERPVDALTQSYLRTKVTDHDGFRRTMQLRTNSSKSLASINPTRLFSSSTVPKVSTLRLSLSTREPSPKPVVPLSPVRV